MKLKKGDKVLDFGCGIGNLVWALRQFGIGAIGIDPSIWAKYFCRIPKYCEYKKTYPLPYKNSQFDLVYSNEVLEHIPEKNIDKYINELYRVSKGIMIHMIGVKDRGKIVTEEKTHEIIENEIWWKKKFIKLGFTVKTGNMYYFAPNFIAIFSNNMKRAGLKKGYLYVFKQK